MFDSQAMLFSGILMGLIGMGLLMYGKTQHDLKCLAGGAAFSIFPFFVHSVLVMWVVGVACGAGLYLWRRAA